MISGVFGKIFGFLKKIIRGLWSTIRSYLFASFVITLIVCIAIWFLGPRISISGYRPLEPVTFRLVAICAAIFIWGLNNLVTEFYRKRRAERAEEKKKEEKPRDPIRERVDTFEASFRNAMSTIKTSWIGRDAKQKTGSLYALPWYVVMGFPAAGKTSLIVESDLKLPLAHLFSQEDAKHVTETEDVDYWVTDEAVLFDVAGQILTHQRSSLSDNVLDVSALLWHKFLGLLQEYRPRRPINGAVVCIDVIDLIQSSPEVRDNKAALLHARLVEMSEALGTRYTVHVLLTKVDLLDGFHEFISGLPQSQRQEPFGFTFDVTPESAGNAWIEEFSESFDAFLQRVNDLTLDRILDQRSITGRRKLYTFSRQLAGLRDLLLEFLTTSLHQDKFSTAPQVRGVFMTSCRQEAVPFNAVLTAASQKYEIRTPVLPVHNGYSKNYFAGDLLKTVVFREAGLAGDNIRIERAKKMRFAMSAAAASVLFVGFSGFYWLAYDANRAKANEVVDIAKTFQEIQNQQANVSGETAGAAFLKPLNSLKSAAGIFGSYRDWNPVSAAATLYQGKKIGPEIEKSYVALLDKAFLPDIGAHVHEEIDELGKDPKTKDSDARLEALRIYLMLGDRERRNNTLVEGWVGEVWQDKYTGEGVMQGELKEHLKFALETVELETKLDEKMVLAAQSDLREVPRDLRLYRNIEQLGDRQLITPVNLRNEIGPAYNIIFETAKNASGQSEPVEVKPFFTKGAFKDFFIKQNDTLSVVAVEDAWVAGERDTVSYSPEDLESFQRKVAGRYATNYITAWSDALNALEMVDFENVDHAVDVLEEITGPENPFGRLLARVKEETEIYEEKLVELEAEQATNADLPFDLNREQGLRIRRAFFRLNDVGTALEDEKAYLEDLQAALDRLYEYLKEIRQAGERSGEVALTKAKARIKLEGDDPIYVIRRLGVDLPEPLNRFFDKIADQSWKVVLKKAKEELQRAWNEEVYAEYNLSLSTRYPFTVDAREEVPLQDFEAFFGPGGRIEKFYEENLVLFVDEASGDPRTIDGRSLVINRTFLTQLKKSLDLRKHYFSSDGTLGISYTIEPKSLSGKFRRAVMNVEGQIISYTHGPRRPIRVIWPNELSKQAESKLTVFPNGRGRPQTISFTGPWSGFRLLDSGTVTNFAGNGTVVRFDISGASASYVVTQDGQKNPAAQSPLTDLILPARM